MADYFGPHNLFLTKSWANSDSNLSFEQKVAKLKKKLKPKTIISVFGLAGVGKGTLSDLLASTLEIPNLDTGKIWRAITYIYTTLNLEISPENTDLVLQKLQVEVQAEALKFCFGKQVLTHSDLKNGLIDSKVSLIARDDYTHQQFFAKCLSVYQSMTTTFVRDGRGASPKDIKMAEDDGFQVIRLLLDCSDEIKWQRYYHNIFLNKRGNNTNLENSQELETKLQEEFKNNIIARNQRDINTQIELGNGLITPQTAVIKNDFLNPQEVLELAIDFIDQSLGLE